MIDWSKQHCGVHQAPYAAALALMPDLFAVLESFPDPLGPQAFTWDIKVHMLMPRQFPCIPNWHQDFVPRPDGRERHDLITPEYPMWMWLSGPPLTEFRTGFVRAREWVRFTQADEHRGTPSGDFCWRGFIRATHQKLQPPKPSDWPRRHCQVYLDAGSYRW